MYACALFWGIRLHVVRSAPGERLGACQLYETRVIAVSKRRGERA